MNWKGLVLVAIVALASGLWAVRADAGDTVRLVLSGHTSASGQLVAPDSDAGVDTLAVRWYRGGRYYHPYRYYYYPRYAAYYYPYRYRSYYYSPYYAPPAYYYYGPRFWAGCYRISLGNEATPVQVASNRETLSARSALPGPEYLPAPRFVQDREDTVPYDGGPRNQVPLPRSTDPAPRPALPLDGKPVSLPSKPSQFAYRADGDNATRKPANPTTFAIDRLPQPKKVDTRSLAGK